jgi:hypothetical protein
MLKGPTAQYPEDSERILKMNSLQAMKALNHCLDNRVISDAVDQLKACQSVNDFKTLIDTTEERIHEEFSNTISAEHSEQAAGFAMATIITRYATLHILQDIKHIQAGYDEAVSKESDTDIRNYFYDVIVGYFAKEPLKSLIAARPELEDNLIEALCVNFNMTQNEHIPKAMCSDKNEKQRMSFYYAVMNTNSKPPLFSELVDSDDINDFTKPLNQFPIPELLLQMASTEVPTATCPVAHLDAATRAQVMQFMETGDDSTTD